MKRFFAFALMLSSVLVYTLPAFATNGDNLIAVGPIARAMGGVGIAEPMDAISAVFANPAAMCFGDYCPASEMNFAGTMFMPKIKASITHTAGTVQSDSEDNIYAIPAIGFTVPIGSNSSNWRFGLAAYGVTGLGVDYRGSSIDNKSFYNFGPFGNFPLVSGEYTSLQIMKFAPAVAYRYSQNLSFGITAHIDYAALDLRSGTGIGYALGVQPGMIYKMNDNLSFGLTYVSPQKVTHKKVADFNQDGVLDNLALESPQQVGLGISYNFAMLKALLEFDGKWINWANADGYKDFDWENQWVYSMGAQFEPAENLTLRVGYNYGKNPVKTHDGFNGSINPFDLSQNTTNVQGKLINNYYYETFRIIGFPAIVEQHVTFGVGYKFSDKFSFHLGVMHAFEKTISESGLDIAGTSVTLKSTLSENSLDFGLAWRF
jgi:long-chain fatty acid transport protein